MIGSEAFAQNLNVIFKISERCNLKCDYCYFFFSGDESWKLHDPVVSPKIIESVAEFCRRAAKDYRIPSIRIIFHGGEPLLMRRQKFDQMCDLFRSQEDGFTFKFSLQTNAALINDQWIDVLSKHRVGVGVSLDGPPDVNDRHRLDVRGRSTYELTVRGLKLLQAAASNGKMVEPGVLAVIEPKADGDRVYNHLVQDLNVRRINFLLPDFTHDSSVDASTIGAVERYLLSALRAWMKSKRADVRVRFFAEALSGLGDARTASVYADSYNDYRNLIAVSSTGDIGPEDTLHGADPRFASMGLNVTRNTLRDVFSSDIWDEQRAAGLHRPPKCRDCDWWSICKGGKPINRFSRDAGFDNPSIYCKGLQEFYSEVAAFLVRNGTPVESILNNLAVAR